LVAQKLKKRSYLTMKRLFPDSHAAGETKKISHRAARAPHARIAAFVFLILCMSVIALAKDGRDFAGFYQLTDLSEQGDSYHATLKLRVFNYSEADIAGATVKLSSSLTPDETYYTFTAVSVEDRNSVRLSGEINIPREEYEMWRKGASPELQLEFIDDSGKTCERKIEVSEKEVE
jgi:hypothetical protein